MFKRMCSFLLALAMLIGMLPMVAQAEEIAVESFSFDCHDKTLYVCESTSSRYFLNYSFEPFGASEPVTMTSSNPEVAFPEYDDVLDCWRIYYNQLGTAAITATTASGLTDTCNVTVTEMETVYLDQPFTVTVQPHDKALFSFIAEDEDWYSFYSENGEGSLNIDWRDKNSYGHGVDTQELYGAFVIAAWNNTDTVQTYTLRVKKAVPIEDIIFEQEHYEGYSGDSLCIRVSRYPVWSIPEEPVFTSSDENVVYYDPPDSRWVTLADPGTATITATTENGVSSQCTVTVREAVPFTVEYDANGGTGAPDAQTGIIGKSLVIPSKVLTRDGYNFLGWSENPDAVSASYHPGERIFPDEDMTLYAVWALPLVIVSQPQSVTVRNGETAETTVVVNGEGLVYIWQYCDVEKEGITDITFMVDEDATTATYSCIMNEEVECRWVYCMIIDKFGNFVDSDIATLIMAEDLKITSQPKSVIACVDDAVSFEVVATGDGRTYQWQYRTSSSDSWANVTTTGNRTATLPVSVTASKNGYQYRCEITDVYGDEIISDAATLTVKSALMITMQPQNVTANVGDSQKFDVAATGEGLTYQWQWRKNASASWAATTVSGNKTATISVLATTVRNGYQYRCKITDAYGNVAYSSAATLTVKAGITISTQPASVTTNVGKTATFKVVASGSGLKYQWQWRKDSSSTWATTTVTGNKTATISVPVTAARNGYQYRCKITDAYGNVAYSNAATLTVKAGITISTQPASVTANVGNTATFKVVASGSSLKYQWQWRKNSSSTWATTTVSGNKTATISVPATTARNGYQYRCKITDAYGNIAYSNAATLTVKSGPVISAQPKSVTADVGDALTFKVSATGTGLTYQWQYRTSSSGTWKVTTLSGAKTATLKVTASTVRNGYQYRCKITDANGKIVYSSAATLTVR